ncbi:MAG TPA: LptF/LptG family permease, partial [Saprospiraceae bacterium]|nr:LptF/LptG family permease [Saprospiraceae bacterium]
MKIIDRLLVQSFLPPFVVTFMIATFVLLIQILWVYIDDLTGKGLGFLLIAELLAYKCVSLVPMALPLAILISSVMVLGNLAEHYELSSLKSAGVSLFRVMGPMAAFGVVCAGVSYYCSDYLIPVSNLKFGSRMYDIQRQKPALRLDEGVFNDDFQGFAIRIGNKKGDGQGIEDVLIYDHKSSDEGSYNQINARSGKMFTSSDQKYFVMKLRDGHQYSEPRAGSRGSAASPFVRTN